MERVTHPYGETPEAVIRERLESAAFDGMSARLYLTISDYDNANDLDWSPTDLLTVLDALKLAAEAAAPFHYRREEWPKSESGKLRISILAALGIDESGAETPCRPEGD